MFIVCLSIYYIIWKKEKRVFCCPYTSLVYWKYKLNWLKPHKNKNKKTMFSRLV